MTWLSYFCLLAVSHAMKCSDIHNSSLPCAEVPPCSSGANNSSVEVQVDKLADGTGLASSYSSLSICFNESGIQISQINFDQRFLTPSNLITECNDPVGSSNSASVHITPHDARGSTQCFTEFDVSPVNITNRAGVFVSRLPIPPQSFDMWCNSSGLTSETRLDTTTRSWQLNMFLAFSTINCPHNCPSRRSSCVRPGLNTSFDPAFIDEDMSARAESVYRANFFRVNEETRMGGNGLCTVPQNSGRCQTLAWQPTPELHNISNFGYLLLQLPEEVAEIYSYQSSFDDMYTDVSVILAIFVFISLLLYTFCFQNLQPNTLMPRAIVVKAAPPSPPVEILISGLSYFVPVSAEAAAADSTCCYTYLPPPSNGGGGGGGGEVCVKQLLCGVDLTVSASKVTAVMGPSGAGKTTLMDLLVSRKQGGVVVGGISFNGTPIAQCAYHVAFVQSTDVQIGEFTVLQSLMFAALLRINSHNAFKKEDCYDRCVRVAASVGLTDVLHTVIGSALRKGISGGQMRRLTIATELLADPHVICLDEPTTGLDSATSLQLAGLLSHLAADRGKTILCTVHQPSDDMLNTWDRLILLGKGGRVVFSGDIGELGGYMAGGGHVPRGFQNGLKAGAGAGAGEAVSRSDCVEFVLELLHEGTALDLLAAQWASHQSLQHSSAVVPEHENIDIHSSSAVSGGSSFVRRLFVSDVPFDLEHVKVLLQRHALYSLLSAEGIRSIAARNLVSGAIYSVLYYQNYSILMNTGYVVSVVGTDFVNEFYNVMGLVYSIVTNVFMMNAVSVPALYQLNRFYSVEKEKKLYHFGALWLTFFIVDMLQQAFGALLFSVLIYRLVELDMPFLGLFYPAIMLTALFASSVAMWCGLVQKTATSSLAMFIVVAVFNMNFAGYLVTESQMEDWLDWLLPAAYMRYAVGLLFNQIFSGVFVLGDVLVMAWDYGDMTSTKCLLIALGWFVGIQLLIMAAMFPWPSRLKRFSSMSTAGLQRWGASLQGEGGQATNPLTLRLGDASSYCEEDGAEEEEQRAGSVQLSSAASFSAAADKSNRLTFDDRPSSEHRPSSALGGAAQGGGGRVSMTARLSSLLDTDRDAERSSTVSYVENRQSYFESSQARTVPLESRVTFCFRDISYTIPAAGRQVSERRLLRDVSGVVRPGEMMALMGPSGAGKTTLLNALAGRTNAGRLEGALFVNSRACQSLRAASSSTAAPFYAFVMQDDHHNPMLTVKDTLVFAAMLRRRTSRREEVMHYVDSTIDILGLAHIADDFVNTPEKRTMSNGQLRRLTIGVEVVCAPPLIFLDEPTSGLDSYLALSVVNSLKSLAKAGHTILCTIHQPSSVTFDKFDKLTLLCAGEMLYHGDIGAGKVFFEKLGHPNNFANSAEFFIDACSSLPSGGSSGDNRVLVAAMVAIVKRDIQAEVQTPAASADLALPAADTEDASLATLALLHLHMISTLLQRDLLTNRRRADFWRVCMLKALVAGTLTGLVFYDVQDNTTIPRLAAGVVSFSYMTLFLNEYTPLCHDEKLIFYRENEVKVVSAFAQWLVVGFLFSLLLAVSVLLYTAPLYFLMGLRQGWWHFAVCYGSMLLQLFSSIYTVQLVVYLTPNATVTATIFPGFVLLLQGSMCGFSILISTMQDWFSWLKYPNAMYWAMNAFFRNEFKGNPHTVGYESLAESFAYDNTLPTCFLIVAIISAVIRLLTLVAMKYVTFSKA